MKPELPEPETIDTHLPTGVRIHGYTPATVNRLVNEAYEAGKADAFKDEGDLLTIAYLHGFAKGKDSALPPPEQK